MPSPAPKPSGPPRKPLLPAFQWPGGKRWATPHILPLIAARPHNTYTEPFAGGVAILLAKSRSPVEVINDTSQNIVNFYRVLRAHPEELRRQIAAIPHSRAAFLEISREAENPDATDIEKAAAWLRRQQTSFAGNGHSFVPSTGIRRPTAPLSAERLQSLCDRLQGVCIEDIPHIRFLDLYDRPDTLHYLDPPYVNCATTAYPGWTEADLTALHSHLQTLQADWILSINDTPHARALFAAHPISTLSRKRGISHTATAYGELLITRH